MKAIRTSFVFVVGVLAACGAATYTGNEVVARKTEGSERQVTSSDDKRFFMLNVL